MTSTVNPPPCDLDMVVLKIDANNGVRLRTEDEQTEDGNGDTLRKYLPCSVSNNMGHSCYLKNKVAT